MDPAMLTIERLGGFAGFGGPNLKSEGTVTFSELSEGDKQAVKALFAKGAQASPGHGADRFRYRLTWQDKVKSRSVEVAEEQMPAALAAKVQDTIR